MRPSTPLLQDEPATLMKEKFSYTIAEIERYRNDPFWKALRLSLLFELVNCVFTSGEPVFKTRRAAFV